MEMLTSAWSFTLNLYAVITDSTIFKIIWYVYQFLIGYCAYLTIWKAWQKGYLPIWLKIVVAPWLLVFGGIDVASNYVLGTIIFFEPPRRGELTLSLRSERYHKRVVEKPNFIEKWRHVWGVILSWTLNPFSQAIGEGDHI